MKGLAPVIEAMLAGRGVYGHAANGIAHGRSSVRVMIVMAVAAVVVAGAAVAAAAGTL